MRNEFRPEFKLSKDHAGVSTGSRLQQPLSDALQIALDHIH